MKNPLPSAVFLIHLVQDIANLRPLIFMAARDFGFDTLLLVSTKLSARDALGIWRAELHEICQESGARSQFFDTEWEAYGHLDGHGLLIAASESHLPNHATTHNIFRIAPADYLRVTLQHGFECVGFRHSSDHVRAHGVTASFGADILCAWAPIDRLTSLAPSQRNKVIVTGPTAVLQSVRASSGGQAGSRGLVCENLHSVRFASGPDVRSEFVTSFETFCRKMARRRKRVGLRPHPGGQYVIRNRIPLPANADLENAPIYRMNLGRFAYGISAPSSVLIDLLLAGIPTAVWRDRARDMDSSSYNGLTEISSPREWVDFAEAAQNDPSPFVALQDRFLAAQQVLLDPAEVYARFAELFISTQARRSSRRFLR
jgi:hypothetical protein